MANTGITFWKCGSRKLYAVPKSVKGNRPIASRRSAKKHTISYKENQSDSSEDQDFKKPKLTKTACDIKEIKTDIIDVRILMNMILTESHHVPLPISVITLVNV